MTDYFALLGLPRSAVLDEAVLQAAWHEKSRAAHPDQSGGNAALAAEINAAYETLSAPEKRLKHLLELHAVPWRATPISAEMMDLFSNLGSQLQNAAVLTKTKQQASSALAKALLAPQEMRIRELLEQLGLDIEAKRETILNSLSQTELNLEKLQVHQATLAYLAKWQGQVREALLALM